MAAEAIATGGMFTPPTSGGGGGGETDPPTDSATAPAGSTYYDVASAAYVIEVEDAASDLAFVTIFVKFSDRDASELVYSGIGSTDPNPGRGFVAPYENSTLTGSGASYTFNVKRTDGWPADVAATFTVRAVDMEGNVL